GERLALCFFFSSRRRHTRLVSDWSSDVCSSDLGAGPARQAGPGHGAGQRRHASVRPAGATRTVASAARCQQRTVAGGGGRRPGTDRKSGVEGKRGERGGGREAEENKERKSRVVR